MYIKSTFVAVFLILFLSLSGGLEAPVMSADSENNVETTIKDGGSPELDDALPVAGYGTRLESLTQTLTAERRRLEELELEHKKISDEIMASTSGGQQEFGDNKSTPPDKTVQGQASEKHLQTTLRQDTTALSLQNETLEQTAKIDFKDLKLGGNVDLLGTAEGLYKLLQYSAALQIYQSIDPEKTNEEDNAWILYQTANCCKNLKQFDNALKACQKLQINYPNTYPAKEAHWLIEDLNWWKQWYEKEKQIAKSRLNPEEK